jgi:hypothetical protein
MMSFVVHKLGLIKLIEIKEGRNKQSPLPKPGRQVTRVSVESEPRVDRIILARGPHSIHLGSIYKG